jgi:type IV pilus assembly protein PilN
VIRTNLSTRPFYNERAVHTWLLVAAAVVAAVTVFNVTRVLRYSRSDTQLAGEAARDETRAGQLRQQAAQLRSTVDPRQIEFASTEARQANELIDRRTFSWTELFNKFETTLPDDVRITSVRPLIDKQRGIVIEIAVVARGFDDVKTFMDHLQATGSFKGLGPVEEHYDENGLLLSSLEAIYVPDEGKPVGHQGATRR